MDTFFLKIADFVILVVLLPTDNYWRKTFKKNIFYFYKDFFVKKSKKIDFIIHIKNKTDLNIYGNMKKKIWYIDFFKERGLKRIETYYQLSPYQFQILVGKIIFILLTNNDGLFIHASANNINNKAVVFTGEEKSGKSFISNMLNKKYPKLADDTVFIRVKLGKLMLYQTPFVEKNKVIKRTSCSYPISKIIFLNNKHNFLVKKLTNNKEVINKLIANIWFYGDKNKIFKNIISIAQKKCFYELNFSVYDSIKIHSIL